MTPPATQRTSILRNKITEQERVNYDEETKLPSPDQSPPVVKKKLCRVSKGYSLDRSRSLLSGITATQERNRINDVNNERYNNVGDLGKSTVRNIEEPAAVDRGNSRPSTETNDCVLRSCSADMEAWKNGRRKRVAFSDNIMIHRLEADGKETVCFESLDQLIENGGRTVPVSPPENGRDNSTPTTNCRDEEEKIENVSNLESQLINNTAVLFENNRPSSIKSSELQTGMNDRYQIKTLKKTILSRSRSSSEPTVRFIENGSIVQLSIVLDRNFRPEEVSVRANLTGNRIRVVGQQEVARRRRSFMNLGKFKPDVNEQYYLPVSINPHHVIAKFKSNRCLVIEAPVVQWS